MVAILSPSGVELPDPGDAFSRAQYNRNVTKTNDFWSKFTQQSLAVPDAGWQQAVGGLTKYSLGTLTLVVMDLWLNRALGASAFTIPAGGSAPASLFTAYIPAGYRPASGIVHDFAGLVIDNSNPYPAGTGIVRIGTDGTLAAVMGPGQAALTIPSVTSPTIPYSLYIKGSWTV